MTVTNTLMRRGSFRETSSGRTMTEVWKCDGFSYLTASNDAVLAIARNPDSGSAIPNIGQVSADGLVCVDVQCERVIHDGDLAFIAVVYSTESTWWGAANPLKLGGMLSGRIAPLRVPVWRRVDATNNGWIRNEQTLTRVYTTAVYEEASPNPADGPLYLGVVDSDDVRKELTRNAGRIRTFPDNIKMVLTDFHVGKRGDNLERVRLVFSGCSPVKAFPTPDFGTAGDLGNNITIPALGQFDEYAEGWPNQSGIGTNPSIEVVTSDLIYEPWIPMSFTVDGIQ